MKGFDFASLMRVVDYATPSILRDSTQHLLTPRDCKVTPSSPHWPIPAQWQALNESISGRLIEPWGIGEVCHQSSLRFDNETCLQLQASWRSSAFHADNPMTMDYNDEACPPNAALPCSTDTYPAYIVVASETSDVQKAVKFAEKTGVRLTVRGTGHDFLARSTAPGSLSIYTAGLPGGVTIDTENAQAIRYGGVAAVKVAAGLRWGDVYKVAAEQDLTVVGGADVNVGIGGWILGGGHSPLGATYGMGADQVLEMDVVTADGSFLTINEDTLPDLFWAMRGGGGGTFAILISVTIKAFPRVPISSYKFSFLTKAASETSNTYWSMISYFHNQIPALSEAGMMGYYYLLPTKTLVHDLGDNGLAYGGFLFPFMSQEEVLEVMAPLERAFNNSEWGDPIHVKRSTSSHTDFWTYQQTKSSEGVGYGSYMTSRLLDKKALEMDIPTQREILRTATTPGGIFIGHIVSGPGPRNVGIPGGSNAINPVWRKTYAHVVSAGGYTLGNATMKEAVIRSVKSRHSALTKLAPDTGAYLNEADPTEPTWKESLYGENYPRLLEIKQRWDPKGVFYCRPCVGHDLWETIGGTGVGQDKALICRK